MKRLVQWAMLITLFLALQSCAAIDVNGDSNRVPIPGGSYSWGANQREADYVDVEAAQSKLILHSSDKHYWERIVPTQFYIARAGALRDYYPMQARWKLRDGREFVLESVDTGRLVRAYFSSQPMIRPQWEREGRVYAFGDAEPMLAHYVKGDALHLKWVIMINRTPINERVAPNGAANPWVFEVEEYPVAIVKGAPSIGIDFAKTYDPTR